MIFTEVNRNVALREAGKHHETSAMMTKRLRQIIDEMEARTREVLELARELEESFGTASATVNNNKRTQESPNSPEYHAYQTCKAQEVDMDRFGMM